MTEEKEANVSKAIVVGPEISLNAIFATTSPSTMRLLGCIGEENVITLIDYDSTCNFLDPYFAQKYKLCINNNIKLPVKIANGNTICSEGNCEGLNWKV